MHYLWLCTKKKGRVEVSHAIKHGKVTLIEYEYKNCDFKAKQKSTLKYHTEAKHLSISVTYAHTLLFRREI